MHKIVIISASVRIKRNSHRVALFFKKYLEENNLAAVEILDLDEYQFPIFNERLRLQVNPAPRTLEFAGKIKDSDGVLIITPEYNGGYPAALKNVVDLLYDEWYRKPIAISTVSSGPFGGSQVITSLQFSLWKIRAWTVPAMFSVPNVTESFQEDGTPVDKVGSEKRAALFTKEFAWCMEASQRMKEV
jgi:NAD(P)H-dependent FMN reductase